MAAQVLRDGRTEVIDSEDLVPGDVVTIEAGDKVPADLRLVHGVDVELDESALTGESAPVAKDEMTLEPQTLVADRSNMLYSGTFVTAGQATGVTVATGAATELGRISAMIGAVERLATPLVRQMDQFARQITVAVLAVSALVCLYAVLIGGYATEEAFMAVVGLSAGPSFFAGIQTTGISLVFVGLVVAALPHAVAILVGAYVLKMNPLIVLGACAGAGTITAALRAVQEEADSKLPALGYTVPYAVGNILLTAWGPVIVALMR